MDGAETPGAYRAVFQYADPDLDGKVRINKNEVKLKDGVLVIRYTSSPAEELSSPLLSGEPAELPDQAVAVEQKKNGTRDAAYYLNGDQDRELSDTSGIVLLEDRPYVTGAPTGRSSWRNGSKSIWGLYQEWNIILNSAIWIWWIRTAPMRG